MCSRIHCQIENIPAKVTTSWRTLSWAVLRLQHHQNLSRQVAKQNIRQPMMMMTTAATIQTYNRDKRESLPVPDFGSSGRRGKSAKQPLQMWLRMYMVSCVMGAMSYSSKTSYPVSI